MAIFSGKTGRDTLRFWTVREALPKDTFPLSRDAGMERRDHSEPDGAMSACAFFQPIGSPDVA
jgi:hypothetical protein